MRRGWPQVTTFDDCRKPPEASIMSFPEGVSKAFWPISRLGISRMNVRNNNLVLME